VPADEDRIEALIRGGTPRDDEERELSDLVAELRAGAPAPPDALRRRVAELSRRPEASRRARSGWLRLPSLTPPAGGWGRFALAAAPVAVVVVAVVVVVLPDSGTTPQLPSAPPSTETAQDAPSKGAPAPVPLMSAPPESTARSMLAAVSPVRRTLRLDDAAALAGTAADLERRLGDLGVRVKGRVTEPGRTVLVAEVPAGSLAAALDAVGSLDARQSAAPDPPPERRSEPAVLRVTLLAP
jgi:hypothetical protein